jgi:ribosomal-protein-alanine N-acetyltransferase
MDTLAGKLVRLRALRHSDYEVLASLKNDLRTQAWNQRLPPSYTPATMKERYEKSLKRPNTGVFAIETLDGHFVGSMEYREGPPRLSATIGTIIAMEYWGRGHGAEAIALVLRFLFEERGLQVVGLWTQSENVRAVRAAEKLGFRIGARLRENSVVDGKLVDALYMDILREEFYKSRDLEDQLPALGA